jgi:cardiolipin synthase
MRISLKFLIFIAAAAGLLYFIEFRFGLQTATVYSLLLTLGVVSVGVMIFLENRHPSKTLAWIFFLALFPGVGLFFYFIFGRNRRKRLKFGRKAEHDASMFTFAHESLYQNEKQLEQFGEDGKRLIELAAKLANSPVSFATSTRVLTDGEETFGALLEHLEAAERHIHMEYYIYRNDGIGTKIRDILIRKAREGLEVRFLYDAVGSLKLPNSFLKEMQEAGVEVAAFNPVTFPLLSDRMNYRNHRKIVVIDGTVGFVGGLNVGDEYLGRDPKYGYWRDTHLYLRGEAVGSLQAIFLRDWNYAAGGNIWDDEYFTPALEAKSAGTGALQIVASGPDQEWQSAKNLYFFIFSRAKHSIRIATPYFIPDEDILTAIQVAALSGVDVKMLFPKKPDKWIPYYASHSYFQYLLEAGVQIYEYEKGFMHSKVLIIDGEMASIGTVNLDIRSFNLNFEVSAFLYGREKIAKLADNFDEDLRHSTRLDPAAYNKSFVKRLLESAARLLSPLL